jgi:flavodoxin
LHNWDALDNEDVRKAAVQELGEGWLDQPGILVFLVSCFLDDSALRPEEFRDASRLDSLSSMLEDKEGGLTPTQRLDILQDRATHDPDEQVRHWAQGQLAKLEPQNQ